MGEEVDSVRVPVVEEELKLARKPVETGRVRVRTIPREHTQLISESLQRTDVSVERVPMDSEVDCAPPVREEGETVVVPVVEERLVKKLFLIEEVRLTRRTSTREFHQSVTLHGQKAVVEREERSGEGQSEEE